MLESSEYVMAWVVYLLSTMGLLAVWWRLTKAIPWLQLKQLVRIMVAAPLVMPAPVVEGSADWAPALFVLLFDITLIEQGDALRGVAFILYAQLLGLVVLLADSLFQRWCSQRGNAEAAATTNQPV